MTESSWLIYAIKWLSIYGERDLVEPSSRRSQTAFQIHPRAESECRDEERKERIDQLSHVVMRQMIRIVLVIVSARRDAMPHIDTALCFRRVDAFDERRP